MLEDRRPNVDRPRATIESLRAWERDETPMNDCRTAAIEAHAAAPDAIEAGVPDAVEAVRAAHQAAAVADMFERSRHEVPYAAEAIKLSGTGDADRKAERKWQGERGRLGVSGVASPLVVRSHR
nr:hypothetical protein [Arthrobacter sp. SO3]